MPKSIEVKMVDVVGPFVSTGSCAVVLSGQTKMVAVPCATQLVQSLITPHESRTPYTDMVDVITACGMNVLSCRITNEEGMAYSIVLMGSSDKKPMKISAEGPSMSLGLAKASGAFLSMPEATFDSLPDCRDEYAVMRDRIHGLFPLPSLTITEDLRATCDFMDRVRWH